MPAVQIIFDSNGNDMERTPACAELWGFCGRERKRKRVQPVFKRIENDTEITPACAELWDFADVVGSESGLSPLL